MSCLFRSRKHSCFTLSVIILVLFSFAFISCGNLFNPETQESSASGNGGVNSSNIVTFRGTVSNSGAVPSEIAANSSLSGSTRQSDNLLSSAMPVFNTTDYEYFAYAESSDGSTVNGDFDPAHPESPVFELSLATGTWTITCGVKNKTTGEIALSDSFDNDGNPLTAASPIITHTFYPKPVEGGTGSIALQMTLDDSVDSVKVLCPDSNFPSLDRVCSSPYTLELSDIPSGSYEVTFIFLDGMAPSDPSALDTRTFLYSTTQTINVIKGMVTNTWHSDGTSLFTTSGSTTTFYLTDDIIKGFLDTTIYVGQNSAATSVNVTASDINSGHAYNPLAHLQAAVDKIAAAGDSTKDYKIFVSGTVTGTTELTSALGTTDANKKAKSITLCGLTGLSGGVPQDVLDGNNAASVLTVNTIVPVKIKNLKISGGNATNGGGLNMASVSTVTLESGAVVGGTSGTTAAGGETTCSNYAEHGGGIYSEGNLTLKNGSSVIYNYGTDGGGICCNGGSLTINAGAKVNLNGSDGSGGGITTYGTELSMTGGEVCNNISNNGAGGLYITKDSSNNCPDLMTISGAKISNNSADYYGSSGGIYYSGGQTLAITGNTEISGNHSKFEGGGIRVAPGVLDLSDCTISGNYSNNGTRPGGGIAANAGGSIKLSGSVYIPAGATIGETFTTGNGCNDVRQNYGSIKIKGALTPPSNCTDGVIASITPNNAVRGTVLFEAEGSVTNLTSYKDNFALTNAADGWELKLSDDNIALKLDAPIYVAGGETTRQVCTADGSASGDGSKSSPFATIDQAVNAIIALNAEVDYTIYVDGVISGHQTIPSALTSGKASSLTIQGASGNTNDILNGNNTTGSVLTINSAVPVTIKDLKITGGKDADGAGIKAEAEGEGAYLVLDQGCLITENDAGSCSGGGVNIIGGTLIMRGNAEISECHGTWGGGIRAQDSDASAIQTIVRLEGNASIKDCTGSEGGGIGLIGSRVFLYVQDNAEISGNTANSDGGGIRLFGSTANISGGVIKENKAVSAGGAVSVKNDGVLNLSGSVWIPEGVTDTGGNLQKGSCKNDIYLASSRKVTIAGALTTPEEADGIVASITPESWTRGLDLIEADGTHVTNLSTYKDYFALTKAADGWELKLSFDNTALKLDAPIYVAGSNAQVCTAAGSSGGNGSKSAPRDTIANACALMSDSTWDYTILVDGEISGLQTIPATANANVIHLKGANSFTGNDNRKDIINANGVGTALNIQFISSGVTSVPVGIENLKITGGANGSNGAGIHVGDYRTVTLGNDLLVQGNNGAGVYVSSTDANLRVNGNVVISGNTVYNDSSKPCNVYLPAGKKINVVGALKKGDEKAQIGITTVNPPTLSSTIAFTTNYGTFNSVAPGTYFTGDQWTVAWGSGTTANEAVLAASGGNITIEPVYEDITVNVDKTSVLKSATEKKFTFSAIGTDSEGNTNPITIGSGEGQLALTIDSVTYHGETVPASYYDTGTDYVTLGNSLPAGNYTINTRAVYQGSLSEARNYSASFEVKIKGENPSAVTAEDAVTAISALTETSTIAVKGEITVSQLASINNSITAITDEGVNVKLDLSDVTGLESLPADAFCYNTHLEEIILPEGLTRINSSAFWLCTNLINIELPSTITEIDKTSFYRVPANISMAADNSVFKTVGDAIYTIDGRELVLYCKKQEENSSFTVPATVTKIGDYAFCSAKIKTVLFEDGSQLTEIGYTAFDCCSNLTTCRVPDSVSVIGRNCFTGCPIVNFHLPAELLVLENGGITEGNTVVVVPDKVTTIKYAAFWFENLTSITLPKSLVELESEAFGGSNIQTVYYKGSETDRASINGLDENENLKNATWVYNYTGD